jgi:8-oxo-dGTP pyrophosphatase MutT (NUDIX family)
MRITEPRSSLAGEGILLVTHRREGLRWAGAKGILHAGETSAARDAPNGFALGRRSGSIAKDR